MEYAKYSTGSNFEGGVLSTSVKPGKEEYENGGPRNSTTGNLFMIPGWGQGGGRSHPTQSQAVITPLIGR